MIKKIGLTKDGNIEDHQCYTTDAKNTWPTDMSPGSRMIIIDTATHVVDHVEYFDGIDWNTYI